MSKKLLFISLIFICLISISFVCATDNSTDESILTIDNSSDAKIIADSQNDDTLAEGEGNFTELSELISTDDPSLDLDKDYTFLSGDEVESSGIIINKTITINGNGHTIDAKNLGRIFSVSGSNVVLKNIKFINGNYSSGVGGAIFVTGTDVILENCSFEDNYASYGGAVFTGGSNTQIIDCEFKDNDASSYGGAVDTQGSNTKVIRCEFSNNTAYRDGGAILSTNSYLSVENSTFENNRVLYPVNSMSYSGGAIYSQGDYANILNSEFINNRAPVGGAVYIAGFISNIKNSTFVNNTASDAGAVFVAGNNLTILDSKFYNNSANVTNGGAIDWFFDYGKLSGSIFVNNSAARRGGGVYSYTWNGLLTDSTFENNSARNSGGGVFWYGNNGKLNNLTFINNFASVGAGLTVFVDDFEVDYANSNTVVNNSTFVNNSARYGAGGADLSSHAKMANSTFINNSAQNYGGALDLTNADAENCEFINNTATFGGAVYTYNSTVKDSKFDGNDALSGNSVYILDKSTLTDNENLQEEDIYLHESGKDRVHVIENSYGIEHLFNTSEGYLAYCTEVYDTTPADGVFDNRLVLLRNSINGEPVGEYLKILIYEYLDGSQDLSEYDFADYVWTFTDYRYWNSDDPVIQNVISLYDSGFRVPTEKACKVLSNGTLMYFDFSSMVTPTRQQNLFMFKFDYGDKLNETFSKETLNETVIVNQTVDFRIIVSNKGESAMYDVFVNDSDYSNGLKYENWTSEKGEWTYNETARQWRLEELLPGESASIIVTFRATQNGTFYNNATDGIGRIDLNNSSVNVTVYDPGLIVEKISLNKTVEIGDQAIFEIIVRNTGDMNLSDVFVIEDEYSDGLVYLGFESIDGEWMHSLNKDGKHVFTLAEKLGVGENKSFYVIFKATKTGLMTNTVVAGYENNTLANSTNVTNVTPNKTKNDTDKTQKDTHDPAKAKAVMKTVKNDGKATGNPLFALLLTLIAIPIARRFEK